MLNNLAGFLLVVISGICWIGVGISVSKCSERNWDYNIVQDLNYLGTTLLCALLAVSMPWSGSGQIFGWWVLLSSLAGRELALLEIRLDSPRSFQIIRYQKTGEQK